METRNRSSNKAEMELLYAKLYEKYTTIKAKKESETEQLNHDQEKKFLEFMAAAEELTEHLRKENERLRDKTNRLTLEVASIRSTKDLQFSECQKRLEEEKQKNKELSEEIGRLQNLQRSCYYCSSNRETSVGGSQIRDESNGLATMASKKRSRHSNGETEECIATLCDSPHVDQTISRESARNPPVDVAPIQAVMYRQPECCKRRVEGSGSDACEVGPATCQFQVLIERLIDMKLSAANNKEGFGISALHQLSGYSFSLTWIPKPGTNETELLYQVSSLGTFERVAPMWMKDVIVFSFNMFPVFFERLSRVLRLGH